MAGSDRCLNPSRFLIKPVYKRSHFRSRQAPGRFGRFRDPPDRTPRDGPLGPNGEGVQDKTIEHDNEMMTTTTTTIVLKTNVRVDDDDDEVDHDEDDDDDQSRKRIRVDGGDDEVGHNEEEGRTTPTIALENNSCRRRRRSKSITATTTTATSRSQRQRQKLNRHRSRSENENSFSVLWSSVVALRGVQRSD